MSLKSVSDPKFLSDVPQTGYYVYPASGVFRFRHHTTEERRFGTAFDPGWYDVTRPRIFFSDDETSRPAYIFIASEAEN